MLIAGDSIIFVHGLNGDPIETWQLTGLATEPKPSVLWPRDFLPLDIEPRRVLTFGYENLLLSCQSLSGGKEISLHLLNKVVEYRQCNAPNRPIIWVAHSHGGLLVKLVGVHYNNVN